MDLNPRSTVYCVVLYKLTLSVPQFLHLCRGYNKAYFSEPLLSANKNNGRHLKRAKYVQSKHSKY